MDYEKAYKEALERARKVKHDVQLIGCAMNADMLEVVFPELEESEDERIRKVIVKMMKVPRREIFEAEGITKEQALAYLERQKEYIDDIRQYAYNKGLVDAEEKQKPVNLDEDVELGLDRALQISKDAKGNLRGYQSDDGIYECDHAIQTLERILKNGIEQKPAEWSEEDETKLRLCIDALDVGQTKRHISEQGITPDELKAWLNSLRPQSKAEWSEEDKGNLLDVQTIIDQVWHNQDARERIERSDEELESLWHWLNNIWQKVAYPQPHWKPTEEQMKALEWNVHPKNPLHAVLSSLYDDLKKLQ